MSLTNRILLAMVAGILTGSLFNLVLHSSLTPQFIQSGTLFFFIIAVMSHLLIPNSK